MKAGRFPCTSVRAIAISLSRSHRASTADLVFKQCFLSEAYQMNPAVTGGKLADDDQREPNLLLVFTHLKPPKVRAKKRAIAPTTLQ